MGRYCKNKNCEESTIDQSGFVDGVCDKCWEQTRTNTKCTNCNSEQFWLEEVTGWKCNINKKTGELECYHKTNDIQELVCFKCSNPINYDTTKGEINFN